VTLADIEGNVAGTWDENLRLVRWADRIGVDAVVPIARWRGYGGASTMHVPLATSRTAASA
jgi:dimethylsulfone monooxygenase